MSRPVLYVLAGVNGAGKSSIGGYLLDRAGLTWFNPDKFARELVASTDCSQEHANGRAWTEGMRRFDAAIETGMNYAFETTLGGNSVRNRIFAATKSHDVLIWFCGLASPELHITRVRARVAAGGHDIPESKIRERFVHVRRNLIELMPHISHLQVYDNTAEANAGDAIPNPVLVMEMDQGRLIRPAPDNGADLRSTPEWAKALIEAALGSV